MRTLLLATLGSFIGTATVWAQAPEPQVSDRTITVYATGTATRNPDRARAHLTVESLAATAAAATEANNAKAEALIRELRNLGLSSDQIRTLGFELHPEYARDRTQDYQEPRIVAYRARNTVQITMDDITRVGQVLDAAVSAGADRVGGLWFELRDPASARAEALANAVATARGEALAIANALGESLGPVLDVSTAGVPTPRPVMARQLEAAQDMAFAVPVEPGPLEITAQVTVVYRLGNP